VHARSETASYLSLQRYGVTKPNGGSVPAAAPWSARSPCRARSRAPNYTRYSLLRTTEEILGVPLLGGASSAASMRAAFGF